MDTATRYWPRRYTVLGLSFCAVFICYMDRINISVAIIPMADDYGWSPSLQGLVLSSFFFGYLLTQVAGGALADRFGGKLVLASGVLIWSLFTFLTPFAAAAGFAVLIACRIAMGLAEGVTFPAVYSLTSRWIPLADRSKAIALGQSGIPTGSIFALAVTPLIAARWGWEWSFYSFGLVGVVWWVFWSWKISSSPRSHPTMSAEELALIESGAGAQLTEDDRIPWRDFLKNKPVWAVLVAWTCANWGIFVLTAWLPTFVNDGLGVDFDKIGWFAMAPPIASVLSMNVAGHLGDRWIRSGASLTRVRKVMTTIGFSGTATALLLVTTVESAWGAVAILCVGNVIGSAGVAGASTNPVDLAPRHAGTIAGIANTVGGLPGVFGVYISGWILELTGSWPIFFATTAGVLLFGMVFYLVFASGEKQFD